MSHAWTEVRDTFILVERTWVRSSEIVTVTDVYDDGYAPPQWVRASVELRNGREIVTRKNARQILDLLTNPGDPR